MSKTRTQKYSKANKEALRYDKILKENIQSVIWALVERVLKIDAVKTEILYPELAFTIEREADFVIMGTSKNGEETVYHIEFQSQNDREMVCRNYMYSALFNHKYRKPVKQIVIYLGYDPLNMKIELVMPDFTFKYELLDMRSFSYRDFLNSNIPEEVILAILCNFENDSNDLVISQILLKLRALDKSETLFKRHFIQLEVLSGLRNLEQIIHQIRQKMPITFDIQKLPSFQEGLEKGIEKGIEKGLEEGIEKGKNIGEEEALHDVAQRLILKNAPLDYIQEITGLSITALKKIQKEVNFNKAKDK